MNDKDTANILDAQRPVLRSEERTALWTRIRTELPPSAPIPSPFQFRFISTRFITTRTMTPVALALVLILGVGGTAAASESSRPGDLLFPIERALENARVSLAFSADMRAELESRFAEERLSELREIIDENSMQIAIAVSEEAEAMEDATSDTMMSMKTMAFESMAVSPLLIVARVFTDTTIVDVDDSGLRTVFETDADTRAEIIAEIMSRFEFDENTISETLTVEEEGRASRPKDRGEVTLTDDGQSRVGVAVDAVIAFVNESELDTNSRIRILEALFGEIEDLSVDVRINNDRIRIGTRGNADENVRTEGTYEMRSGNSSIRIEERDGEIRIQTDNGEENESNDTDESADSAFEAEADVFLDTTIVEVEENNEKTIWKTTARTKETLVSEILSKFNVSRETVESTLQIDVEDRESRPGDNESEIRIDISNDTSINNIIDIRRDKTNDLGEDIAKLEVTVEGANAEVEVERGGEEDSFNTAFISRDILVRQLAARFRVSAAAIESILDLEIK